jgi:phospholipid/cholesterol/gamma-HCH transport system ATP-binding protein
LDVTSIVVTHDMQSAFKVGNRIVMLHEGKLVFDGTPKEVQQSENPIVRNFVLGEASEQELAGLRRRPASATAGAGPARGPAKK